MKILVVDDEKLLVKGIKFNLEQDGYAVNPSTFGNIKSSKISLCFHHVQDE